MIVKLTGYIIEIAADINVRSVDCKTDNPSVPIESSVGVGTGVPQRICDAVSRCADLRKVVPA